MTNVLNIEESMKKDLDLPLKFYKPCPACSGYGWVELMVLCPDELKHWAKRLGQEAAFYGYNLCNKYKASGLILDYELEDLELETR